MNPGPGARGAKGKRKTVKKAKPKISLRNPVVVQSAKGSPLKRGGAAYKKTLEVLKAGKGRKLADGRVKLTVGGVTRYVATPAMAKRAAAGTRAKPARQKRGVSKLRAMGGKKKAAAKTRRSKAYKSAQASEAEKRAKKKAAQRRRDKKKPSARQKQASWRAKHGTTRGRSYKKGTTYEKRAETIKFSEAASASGATFPKTYPRGHAKAGQPHPKAGRIMGLLDALEYQVPVVGFLPRGVIKGFYEKLASAPGAKGRKAAQAYLDTKRYGGIRLKDGTYIPAKTQRLGSGGRAKSNKAAIEKALNSAKGKGARDVNGLEEARRKRGSAWKRSPTYYSRSGKSPGPKGKKYIKGRKRPDYTSEWSEEGAWWQTPEGPHLRVKFRKGRGPTAQLPLYRGFQPKKSEVELLGLGGFGGDIDSPGGVVKLNRGRRRKASRRRKARKNPVRNKKGRFVKKNSRKKKTRRRRKAKATKVYNNPRKKTRRRRRRKARRNPARKRNAKGHFVKSNPRKRRKYRRKKTTAKRNPRKRRRRRRNPLMKRNPLQAQLATVQRKDFWLQVAHGLVGMTGTAMLSNAIMGIAPIRRAVGGPGMAGKFGRFALGMTSAGLLSAGVYMGRGLAPKLIGPRGHINVFVGGAIYATANLLNEMFRSALIPQINVGRSAPAAELSDWMELSGMGGGMGSVESPYDLVAGESAARMSNEFSGIGSSGGYPVPMEDLRGYPGQYGGGINDWIEFDNVPKDSVGQGQETF